MEEKKKPSDREQFSLRIPFELKSKLENKAYESNSSLSNYIYRILLKEIS